MDPERERIQADLSGQIEGQIRCDDLFLEMYSSDASIYQKRPLGIVRPAGVEDVVKTVSYARENNLPVIARGGGSNVVGASLGQGLILDFSYSMRRIVKVDRETVTVQPGIVLAEMNRELMAHDRVFGPDPKTRSFSTIGGILSTNATGSHWICYGAPRDKVVSLDVVTAEGKLIQIDSPRNIVGSSTTMPASETVVRPSPEVTRRFKRRVSEILTRNEEAIAAAKPNTKVNQAGYNIFDLEQDNSIDLTRLLVGSEGTLGIITQATLKTEPLPRHRGVALLFFYSLGDAAKASVEIGKMGVVACDLLDRRLLSLAREMRQTFAKLIPAEAEAMVLAEFQDVDDSSLRKKLELLQTRIQRRKKLAFDIRVTTQKEERNLFWRLTRRVIPSLYRLKGNTRAIPFIEDIVVEPSKLPEFFKSLHQILNKNEVTASIFSHTPQGLINLRPFMNLSSKDDLKRMNRVANEVFEKVLEMGGSITGSNGSGLSRSWYLRRQMGPAFRVLAEIKDVFDPQFTFNPGKIVGRSLPTLTEDIRKIGLAPELIYDQTTVEALEAVPEQERVETKKPVTPLPVIDPQLNWVLPEIAMAARNCNGCGRCRSTNPQERMCPMFRLAPREEASPRAKANLIRGILTGSLTPDNFSKDEFKSVSDLCINCHQCRFECPAGVDVPKMMIEAKSQYTAVNGLKLSDWLLTRLDWLYEISGRMPRATNWMIRTPWARWVLERLIGVAQGRKLPQFSKSSLLRWASRQRLTKPSKQQSRKVVYFVDAYANWNDVELGQAFVKVLQHNNIDVLIPPGQNISGMSLISDGLLGPAKKLAAKNVELLAEWVRQGYQVVTTEPAAALGLSHEYLHILDDADAKLVAENTTDSTMYLLQLHLNGELELDFRPLNTTIGYHLPCHQRALFHMPDDQVVPGVKLLQLIPGLQVNRIEKGCSGMAGTFGMKKKNYNKSLRMGLPLITAMRSPDISAGTTECSTCKIQMEQGTTKPTIHPVKILAYAYGLMPELDDLFSRRSQELVVT